MNGIQNKLKIFQLNFKLNRHGNRSQLQQQQSNERPSTLGPFNNNSASITKQPLPYETVQYLHAASTSNASCEEIKDMVSLFLFFENYPGLLKM